MLFEIKLTVLSALKLFNCALLFIFFPPPQRCQNDIYAREAEEEEMGYVTKLKTKSDGLKGLRDQSTAIQCREQASSEILSTSTQHMTQTLITSSGSQGLQHS